MSRVPPDDAGWLHDPVPRPDSDAENAARARQAVLTKPAGALGELEHQVIRLAGLQGCVCPQVDNVQITLFAADHGVAVEGVSAYPQSVTVQMVRNILRGGAAISVLAQDLGATLEVVDLGMVDEVESRPGLIVQRLGAGSRNFCTVPAMDSTQLHAALAAGRAAVVRAVKAGRELFIGGEMGIANTTVATALGSALLDMDPSRLAGAGTGLDEAGIAHKSEVVRRALARHAGELASPLDILRCVGGFELAALAGSQIAAAQAGLPVLVDGFITTAAALLAVRINPAVRPWLLFSHRSAERGHARLLDVLQAQPLLDLEMRLGEGSGAAVAVPLLRSACRLHASMATFAEAGVSNQEEG